MYLSYSEIKQIDMLKEKTPAHRFLLMVQLINEQFEAMRTGIRHKNPEINDEELEECLKTRMRKIYSLRH